MFTTSNLDDSLVSKWLEYGWCELSLSSTVTNGALSTRTVREDIAVSSEMQRVISAALNEHQVAHVVVLLLLLNLLGARRGTVVEGVVLLLLV
jgi:hypothetical protein